MYIYIYRIIGDKIYRAALVFAVTESWDSARYNIFTPIGSAFDRLKIRNSGLSIGKTTRAMHTQANEAKAYYYQRQNEPRVPINLSKLARLRIEDSRLSICIEHALGHESLRQLKNRRNLPRVVNWTVVNVYPVMKTEGFLLPCLLVAAVERNSNDGHGDFRSNVHVLESTKERCFTWNVTLAWKKHHLIDTLVWML